MSHFSKIFNKVPVQIPNKSGFDMSHENLFTASCGTLVPCMVAPLIPNDSVTLGAMLNVQLPPMATDFFGRVDAKLEAFFVPYRLLYGGWQDLATHSVNGDLYPSGTTSQQKAKYLPYFTAYDTDFNGGRLLDFLGVKQEKGFTPSAGVKINNPLPVLAYNKIWDDWYRDSRIQQSLFERPTDGVAGYGSAKTLPYTTFYGDSPRSLGRDMADGSDAFELRQRNWARDYFTNATPMPQAGLGSRVEFTVDPLSEDASFSIATLRAANSLQQWLERNNLAGYRYADQIRARFGCYPADAVMDRPVYLGSATINVYTKSVYKMSISSSRISNNRNPFNQNVGAKFGSSQAIGECSLVDKFTATEHGVLMVMFSLVPHAYYSTGSRRYMAAQSIADFPDPILSTMGDQAIWQSELKGGANLYEDGVFGYTQLYSHEKYMDDEVHGLLRDGENLSSFALQRSFGSDDDITINSDFLKIPTNFLDQVAAVESDVSNYGCWVDSYWIFKKSSTLPAYSIPTLGDLKDTHTEIIPNGGKRL